MSYNHNDPFAPAAQFPAVKFPLPGAIFDGYIVEVGEWYQATDFETKLPAVWKSGKPKMQMKITLDDGGVDMALYVTQWTNLFKAIQKAREDAQAPLAPGGRLWIKYDGDVPVEGNKILKAKAYTAKYLPPAGGGADPFANVPTTAPAESEIPF